jgi:hypothetical protein
MKKKRLGKGFERMDDCNFEIKVDPSDENSQKTKKAILTFKDGGDAEIWCKWQELLNELYQLVPLKGADQPMLSHLCFMARCLH